MRVAHVKPHKVFTLLTLVSVVCMSLSLFVSATHAAPNYQINYQGKLTDASNVAVANGTYNMRFWLLTSSSVATTSAIWTETLTGTSKVQVTNGLFSVMLGSTSPLTGVDFNQTLYLGVEIGGSGSPSWDGEMSPRKTLGAVPSAFEADRLDGLTSSQFVRTDATSSIATSSASTLLSLTQNGAGDIFNLFDGTTEVFTMTDGGRLGMGTTSPSRLFTMQGGDFYLGGNMTATGTLDVSGLTTLSSFIATNGTTTNATSTNLRVSSLFTLGSDAVSDLTGSGLINSSNALTCATANSSTFGCLTSADWTTFMDKVASSSIDTLAELETLTGVSNILIEGDLDASSELLALMDDETGTGNLVFSASPTFTGGAVFSGINTASSTLGYASTTALTIANRLFDTNNSAGTNGYILKSTGTSTLWVATSTLGFGTGSGSVTSVDLSVPTGFSVSGNPITTSGTLALSYAAGYEGLRTASSTNWNNFWDTPSTRISDGTGLTWSSNTLNCDTATAGAPGCVTAADWTTFMGKVASSSIDTLAELEALQGSINIIQSTEIDTSSELAGILGDETGTGNAVFSTNPLLSGFRSNASSTIGDGTGAGGLTISGNGTTTGNAYFGGTLSLGSTTPESLGLTIDKAGLTGSVIAGIKERLQFTNSTLNAVYYGDNAYIVNAPTATSTLVAKMVRIQDDTSLGNTVRGIEAQAYRGTNTKGENTGLSGFGRTFGVRGTTIGDAGNTYLPAGVYAESQGSTQGNALRAYSGSLTTETLVSLFHDTSIFVGTGLEMNFGNAGGSFAATSSTAKFLDFQVGGTSKFIVAANGSTTIGDGTVSASLRIPYGGICVDNDGSCISTTTGQIRSVSSALGNSDLAEMYFSNQILQMGEIVSLTDGLSVARAGESEEENIIGVVSTKPGMTLGFDDTSLKIGETGYPIGLKGRVPVKLSTENGPIKKGDRITISSIPGIGMKATESSRVVGIALEDYDGTRAYSKGFLNQFGDDMVKERIVNKTIIDPKTQDGCYNGGGSALGEAGCAPDKVIQTAVTTTTDNTEYKDMLAALTNKPALSAETAEGESTTIGQVLMFIELGWYQSDTEKLVLAELTSTSTLLDGNGTDSIWSRIKELAQGFVDGVLTIAGIKADRVEVNDELCVDGVCVNADDLRAILNKAHEGSSVQGTSEGSGTQNPTPEVIEPAVENPALPTEFSSETTPISTDTGVVPEENALTEPSPVTENTVVQEQISEPTTIPETLVAEPGA